MTKPIEGWVKVQGDNSDQPTIWSIQRGGFPTVNGHYVSVELDMPTDGKYRPVVVTFMDKTARDLIEDGVEDNEFNRGLKAMADYVESIAPELNGYIELEAGQKIENALKKDRERILEDLMGIISTSGVATIEEIREIIFGEEK